MVTATRTSSGSVGTKTASASFSKDGGKSVKDTKDSGGGFFSSLGKALGIGGGGGNSSPTSSQRPPARPTYVTQGTGKDTVYTNTRTGQTAAAPEYSAYSWRGLTSNDPGNYMRNQEAAQRYASMPQSEHSNQGPRSHNTGIASVAPTPTPLPVNPTTPTPAPSPALPVSAATAGYAGSPVDNALFNSPLGYGSAFAGLSQPMYNPYGGMNYMDIFSMYPELQYM